jgi:hypothetical protein
MDANRSLAYTRLLRTIEAIGPAKLHEDEQARVREAADVLVFSTQFGGDAREALRSVRRLRDRLVESGRLGEQLADELVAQVSACGPLPLAAAA